MYKLEAIEELRRKVVQGWCFVNACGRKVNIGLSSEAEQALGLPFSIFEEMSKRERSLCSSIEEEVEKRRRLRYRLNTIRDMSFWERLNRVFVGFETLSLK